MRSQLMFEVQMRKSAAECIFFYFWPKIHDKMPQFTRKKLVCSKFFVKLISHKKRKTSTLNISFRLISRKKEEKAAIIFFVKFFKHNEECPYLRSLNQFLCP